MSFPKLPAGMAAKLAQLNLEKLNLAYSHVARLAFLPLAASLLLAATDVSTPPTAQTAQVSAPPAAAPNIGSAIAALPAESDDVTADTTREPLHRLVDRLEDETSQMGRQLACLATAVYFESRGEPLEGQLAVAQTIINRVESGRHADDVCAVIREPGQFSFRHARAPKGGAAWRTAQAIARIAQDRLWPEVAEGAMSFHARRVSPGWQGKTRIARIGNHVFYR
jgi:spore germination cell wall hydrolase CwlJ-like protein